MFLIHPGRILAYDSILAMRFQIVNLQKESVRSHLLTVDLCLGLGCDESFLKLCDDLHESNARTLV